MTQPKLTRIPGTESTVKHSFTLRLSTSESLTAYHAYYCKALGLDPAKIPLKDVAEQMMLDFMSSDKEFQRSLAGGDSAPKPEVKAKDAPAAAEASKNRPSNGAGPASPGQLPVPPVASPGVLPTPVTASAVLPGQSGTQSAG